jgi:FkbM family methyltransferase
VNIDNFLVLDSVYGKFIVDRHCTFQAEALVKTGRTHIEGELSNIFVIVDRLPDNAVIIDGGTNIGFFTIPVAQRTLNTNIKIIGFEPQRQMFQALGGSLVLNGYDHVFLHNCGLGSALGKAQLPPIDYSAPQDFGTVQISEVSDLKEEAWMRDRLVDVTSIDSMNLPRLDFLKLDVEGYEVPALIGGLQTIALHRPWMWIEYFISGHEPITSTLAPIRDYSYFIADYQNMLCIPNEHLGSVSVAGLNQVG